MLNFALLNASARTWPGPAACPCGRGCVSSSTSPPCRGAGGTPRARGPRRPGPSSTRPSRRGPGLGQQLLLDGDGLGQQLLARCATRSRPRRASRWRRPRPPGRAPRPGPSSLRPRPRRAASRASRGACAWPCFSMAAASASFTRACARPCFSVATASASLTRTPGQARGGRLGLRCPRRAGSSPGPACRRSRARPRPG